MKSDWRYDRLMANYVVLVLGDGIASSHPLFFDLSINREVVPKTRLHTCMLWNSGHVNVKSLTRR